MSNMVKLPEFTATSIEWVDVRKLKAQNNPKRVKEYSSLFSEDVEDVFNMKISPMFEFVQEYLIHKKNGIKFDYASTRYHEMQKAYGRSYNFIASKISKFINLIEEISKIGILKPPIIIPLDNGFYEIYDGHHRISCVMALGHERVVCRVIRGQV